MNSYRYPDEYPLKQMRWVWCFWIYVFFWVGRVQNPLKFFGGCQNPDSQYSDFCFMKETFSYPFRNLRNIHWINQSWFAGPSLQIQVSWGEFLVVLGYPPWTTNMASWKNPPFQDVFPIDNGDFPMSCIVFRECANVFCFLFRVPVSISFFQEVFGCLRAIVNRLSHHSYFRVI